MSKLAALLGEVEPLPTTRPLPTETSDDMPTRSPHPALLTVGIVAVVIAGIALIVAGIALGGLWRWAGGVAMVVGIAAIVVPTVAKGKHDNGNGELK